MVILLFITAPVAVMMAFPSSIVFFLPVGTHITCVRLPVQKLFLSGSQSCDAKIQFLPPALSLLSALLLFHQWCLRWGVL